jgi:hypothetical protein
MYFVRTVESTLQGGNPVLQNIKSDVKTDIPVFCVEGTHRVDKHDHLKNRIN